MAGYNIVHIEKIENHITFIRIDPTDIAMTLREIVSSLSDLSWLSSFDRDYHKASFQTRAEDSIRYITTNIIRATDDAVTKDSGEYVVSELARQVVVAELSYLNIPLAELFKIKNIGNHGFDFYTKNHNYVLLFGEAKYNSSRNAYGIAFEQIVRFEAEKQDCSDIVDIDLFCCDRSKTNFSNGEKGFIAAFASKGTSSARLISGIKNNSDYAAISGFTELICVAVNI